MALNQPVQGEYYTSAYQISPVPYVTSSTLALGQLKEIRFSHITRTIHVKNTSAGTAMAVGFTENGLRTATANYFILSGSESYTGEMRMSSLWLSGSVGSPTFTVLAGLTLIPTGSMLHLTASNGYSGVG